jgi:Zn-dependent protease with chaperone function
MKRLRLVASATAAAALLAWAPAAAAAETISEFDSRILAELRARDPGAADQFVAANAARDRHALDEAAAGYESVRTAAPWFTHATRRLCGIESERKHHAHAVALCREAFAQDPAPYGEDALAMALVADPAASSAQKSEALAHADRAARRAPDDSYAQASLCQVAVVMGDIERLDACSKRLLGMAPKDASTHVFRALALASRGDFDAGEQELDTARAHGFPEESYRGLRAGIESARPITARLWPYVWRALVAWLSGFAVLLGAGALLSAAALRAASRAPSDASAHPTGVDALLRRTYRVVLWLTCAYYYASLPLVAVSVLGGCAGLVYGSFVLGQIPIKLLLLAIFVTGTSLWAMAKSLFVRTKDEDPGERVDLDLHPRLRDVLVEVADRVGSRPVDAVYMVPGTDIAVFERGGLLRQLRGKTERCLVVGAGVLDGMRVREVKAILAHEYGHFKNEDTAGGGFALAVRRSILTMATHLIRAGAATMMNPAWWFVRGFHSVFLRISQGASRLQEVLADRWAAVAYGSAAFERGLTHVVARSVHFDAHVNAALNEVVPQKRPLANLYTYTPEKGVKLAEVDTAVQEAMTRPASPFDSHPPTADRLAWVRQMAAEGPPETAEDAEGAWALFASREALEKAMTATVRDRIRERQGVTILAGE